MHMVQQSYPCTTNPAIATPWITYRTVVNMLVIVLVCVQVQSLENDNTANTHLSQLVKVASIGALEPDFSANQFKIQTLSSTIEIISANKKWVVFNGAKLHTRTLQLLVPVSFFNVYQQVVFFN